jgi:hypothetical protein
VLAVRVELRVEQLLRRQYVYFCTSEASKLRYLRMRAELAPMRANLANP